MAELVMRFVTAPFSLCSSDLGTVGRASVALGSSPSDSPRLGLESVSTASTRRPRSASDRASSALSVVLPTPPFPTTPIFMVLTLRSSSRSTSETLAAAGQHGPSHRCLAERDAAVVGWDLAMAQHLEAGLLQVGHEQLYQEAILEDTAR